MMGWLRNVPAEALWRWMLSFLMVFYGVLDTLGWAIGVSGVDRLRASILFAIYAVGAAVMWRLKDFDN